MINLVIKSLTYSMLNFFACLMFSSIYQNELYLVLFYCITLIIFQTINFLNIKSNFIGLYLFASICYSLFICGYMLLAVFFLDVKNHLNSTFFSIFFLFVFNLIISLPILGIIYKKRSGKSETEKTRTD